MRSTENHQRAIDGQTSLYCVHGTSVRHRGDDDPGAAQLQEFRGRILRLAVDVLRRAQLFGQRLLVFPSRDGNRLKSHLRRELHAEMAKSAKAENGNEITGPC